MIVDCINLAVVVGCFVLMGALVYVEKGKAGVVKMFHDAVDYL